MSRQDDKPRPLAARAPERATRSGELEAASPRSGPVTVPPGPPDERVGETLAGRYRLERLIGKGGMGRVYKAIQLPLNRAVAVKILNREFQQKDPQFVRRFFLEAATAARLTHPNTITIFDYGEAESGELFIAMEYLRGRPLSRVIGAEAPFAPARVLHVAMQICRALREAHGKGIIHRDLKPGNILLLAEGDDPDFVKVLDFGLVKVVNPDGAVGLEEQPITPDLPEGEPTRAGMFLGSPKYMSPEQIQGGALDARTDIYSLGVLMFQMATGKPPFAGASSVEVVYQHVHVSPPTLASRGIEPAPELEGVIARMLAKRPEDRFDSMNSLLVALKAAARALGEGDVFAETGVELRLSGLPAARSLPPEAAPARASLVPTSSTAPATDPRSSSRPAEAAFAEPQPSGPHTLEDTGSGARTRAPGPRRLAPLAPWIAAVALVVVVGLFVFVLVSRRAPTAPTVVVPAAVPPPRAPAPAPPVEQPAAPEPFHTVLSLTSDPSGAEVFEDGVRLGVTPLELTLPRSDAPALHEFVFKKRGHQPAVERVRLERDAQAVEVRLRAAARAPAARKPGGEGYKANPY
jgi:serine/threonine protein kinase